MITHIVGENFLSYKGQFVLGIQSGQLNVVIGKSASDYADSNGTGKTTLLKALVWALYGKFPGMEDADSVVNKAAKKNTKVEIYFQKNGVNYVVQRFRKHNESRNNVYLWEGPQQHAGDNKDVQAKIEAAIGIDYDVFMATLVFTGEREDEFASGTDKQQKKVLNALLPLAFEKAYDTAAARYASASVAHEDALKGVSTADSSIEATRAALEQSKTDAAAWDRNYAQEREENRKALDTATLDVEKRKEHLGSYETNDAQWTKFLGELDEQRADLLTKKDENLRKIADIQRNVAREEQLRKRREELTAEDAKLDEEFQVGWKKIGEEIKALKSGNNEHCPTCGQVVQHEALQRTLDKLATEQLTLRKTCLNKHEQIGEQLKAVQTELDNISQGAGEAKLQLEQLRADLMGYENQIAGIVAKKAEYQPAYSTHQTEFATLKSNLARAEQNITWYRQRLEEHRTNPHVEAIKGHEQRLAQYEEAKRTREAQVETSAREMRRWEAVKLMFSGGKGGLHHFIFEQVLPEMTAMAQMFLNFFSANTLKVAFRSHKKKGKKTLEGFFVEAHRGDVEGYGNLSRGEQRRINVAISLTLYLMACKHVFNPGILFLDEVADSLDQTGKQSIIELLEHFCTQYDTAAVLLTNERELIAHVHSGYECVMENGSSTLRPISES